MLVKIHAELKARQDALFAQLRQHKNVRIKFHPETGVKGVFIPIYRDVVDIFNMKGTFYKLVAESDPRRTTLIGYQFGGSYEFLLMNGLRFEADGKTLLGVTGRRIQSTLEIVKKNQNLYDTSLKNAFLINNKLEMMLIPATDNAIKVPTDTELQALKNE